MEHMSAWKFPVQMQFTNEFESADAQKREVRIMIAGGGGGRWWGATCPDFG